MLNARQIFLQNLAQTSDIPLMLDVASAKGHYIYDQNHQPYLDLISGISVSSIGHGHEKVNKAIKDQIDQHSHVMVFGEFIQQPQVTFAKQLTNYLPEPLNAVYFVNSGSEAAEGAMKLAKRYTGKQKIFACQNAYHGSSQGALSVAGNESLKNAFRPLLPGIKFIRFNHVEDVQKIDKQVAGVMVETVQGEAGAIVPDPEFLTTLRARCNQTGTFLILDEIQAGFGRTGSLFAFQDFGIQPDILLLGKALGGGMPLGAFVANQKIMDVLAHDPVLGHISTFGGHPLACTAGNEAMNVLLEEKVLGGVQEKGLQFKKALEEDQQIVKVHGKGLMLAVEIGDFEKVKQLIHQLFERGIISDWFIFNNQCIRIAPPLTISNSEIEWCCKQIRESLKAIKE